MSVLTFYSTEQIEAFAKLSRKFRFRKNDIMAIDTNLSGVVEIRSGDRVFLISSKADVTELVRGEFKAIKLDD